MDWLRSNFAGGPPRAPPLAPKEIPPSPVGDHKLANRLTKKPDHALERYNLRVILRGPSGSGKTSLFRCLQGKQPPMNHTPTLRLNSDHIRWSPARGCAVGGVGGSNVIAAEAKVEVWDVPDGNKGNDSNRTTIINGATGLALPPADAAHMDVYRGTSLVILLLDLALEWHVSVMKDTAVAESPMHYIKRLMKEEIPVTVNVLVLGTKRDVLDQLLHSSSASEENGDQMDGETEYRDVIAVWHEELEQIWRDRCEEYVQEHRAHSTANSASSTKVDASRPQRDETSTGLNDEYYLTLHPTGQLHFGESSAILGYGLKYLYTAINVPFLQARQAMYARAQLDMAERLHRCADDLISAGLSQDFVYFKKTRERKHQQQVIERQRRESMEYDNGSLNVASAVRGHRRVPSGPKHSRSASNASSGLGSSINGDQEIDLEDFLGDNEDTETGPIDSEVDAEAQETLDRSRRLRSKKLEDARRKMRENAQAKRAPEPSSDDSSILQTKEVMRKNRMVSKGTSKHDRNVQREPQASRATTSTGTSALQRGVINSPRAGREILEDAPPAVEIAPASPPRQTSMTVPSVDARLQDKEDAAAAALTAAMFDNNVVPDAFREAPVEHSKATDPIPKSLHAEVDVNDFLDRVDSPMERAMASTAVTAREIENRPKTEKQDATDDDFLSELTSRTRKKSNSKTRKKRTMKLSMEEDDYEG
eukprot:Clim_evm6s54 gene=Clim_evmTU6s54